MVCYRDCAELKTYIYRMTGYVKASGIPTNIVRIIINDIMPVIRMPLVTYHRKTDIEKHSYFIGAICGRLESELLKVGINPIVIDKYKDIIKKCKL